MKIKLFKKLPEDAELIIKYDAVNELRSRIVSRGKFIRNTNPYERPCYEFRGKNDTYTFDYGFINDFVSLYKLDKDKYNQLCLEELSTADAKERLEYSLEF